MSFDVVGLLKVVGGLVASFFQRKKVEGHRQDGANELELEIHRKNADTDKRIAKSKRVRTNRAKDPNNRKRNSKSKR